VWQDIAINAAVCPPWSIYNEKKCPMPRSPERKFMLQQLANDSANHIYTAASATVGWLDGCSENQLLGQLSITAAGYQLTVFARTLLSVIYRRALTPPTCRLHWSAVCPETAVLICWSRWLVLFTSVVAVQTSFAPSQPFNSGYSVDMWRIIYYSELLQSTDPIVFAYRCKPVLSAQNDSLHTLCIRRRR